MIIKRLFILAAALVLAGLMVSACSAQNSAKWSQDELEMLKGLWIGSLPPLEEDPSNIYADNLQAAAFGQQLFFDTRLSANSQVSCATCHLPEQLFQDGTPLAQGIGMTNRRTMTVIGTAYSPWLFWDGRKDSLWAQALAPLENPVEHGGDRTFYAHLISEFYSQEYTALFGPLPDLTGLPPHAGPVEGGPAAQAWQGLSEADREAVTRIFVNMGKAIAAYERLLNPGPSRFDRYVEAVLDNDQRLAVGILNEDEIAGLKLFIGAARCIDCHNGPLFTNNDFHNTGVPADPDLPEDTGRALGAVQVLADEFNCLSPYSDAEPRQCAELNYLVAEGETLVRQFKPPSLRNVAERGPFMHAGQFATLEQVLQHYNTAPRAPAGHSELEPLGLNDTQIAQIIAFLRTLDSPVDADARWLSAPQPAQ